MTVTALCCASRGWLSCLSLFLSIVLRSVPPFLSLCPPLPVSLRIVRELFVKQFSGVNSKRLFTELRRKV
jgi:hypothetical protein